MLADTSFPYMCTSRKLGWTLDTARLDGHVFPSRVQFKLLKLSRGLISDVVVLVFVGLSSSLWTIRWMINMRVFRIVSLSVPASLSVAPLSSRSDMPTGRQLQRQKHQLLESKADAQPAIIFYILSIPASLIAWGHNIATAIFVRDMMREFTGGEYIGTYGNAVWLTLAGTVSTPPASIPPASTSWSTGAPEPWRVGICEICAITEDRSEDRSQFSEVVSRRQQ